MPHELQPKIYRYGVAMPFFNAGEIIKTVRCGSSFKGPY